MKKLFGSLRREPFRAPRHRVEWRRAKLFRPQDVPRAYRLSSPEIRALLNPWPDNAAREIDDISKVFRAQSLDDEGIINGCWPFISNENSKLLSRLYYYVYTIRLLSFFFLFLTSNSSSIFVYRIIRVTPLRASDTPTCYRIARIACVFSWWFGRVGLLSWILF